MTVQREKDGIWMTLEETVANHHEEVFGCFVTAGGLMRWLSVEAEIEPRSGGTLVLAWDPDFTKRTTVAILDFDPGGRIVWDWQASHSELHVPVYWSVDPVLEEGTRITMRQGPYTEDVDSLLVMAEEAQQWRWRLCNLRSVLESKHDMRRERPL